tara:strand:- start:4 stop:231 length:228 start_codon:yes stop_codon:yes gene_type:complete
MFVITFLGTLYLSGLTVILYLTVKNGSSILIRDFLMPYEIPMLVIVLVGLIPIVLKNLTKMIREYMGIIRTSVIE